MSTKSDKAYRGFYINLDKNIDRKIFIEHQLRKIGVLDIYDRFEGIINTEPIQTKLTNPEIGCLKSHMEVLRANQNLDKHIHIIEDDIELFKFHDEVVENFLKLSDDWDIFFTGIYIPMLQNQIEFLCANYERQKSSSKITSFDMSNFIFVGAFSYIINKKSIQKILDIYEKQNYTKPIDFLFREKICFEKSLKAKCMFPMIATHSFAFKTTMENRNYELTYEFQDLFLKPVFASTNLQNVFEEIKKYGKSLGYETQIQEINIRNIYKELFRLGEHVSKTH